MRGLDIEWVIDLDMISFGELIGSVRRNQNQIIAVEAQNLRAAFGAEVKDFTKYIKALQKDGTSYEGPSDAEALIARFGK